MGARGFLETTRQRRVFVRQEWTRRVFPVLFSALPCLTGQVTALIKILKNKYLLSVQMLYIFSRNIIMERNNILQKKKDGSPDAESDFENCVLDLVDFFGVRKADVFTFFRTKSDYLFMPADAQKSSPH